MRRWTRRAVCAALAAGWLAGADAVAGVLYDASLGSKPGAQGWASLVLSPASDSVSAGALTLDTSFGNALQSGYSRSAAIDSGQGFTLSFSSQLVSESHTGNANRAGFSVILLDASHRGVELGFWTDQIWAQTLDNSNQFVKAESAAFNTTALTQYRLTLQGGAYALSANGSPLLSGAMRDYSPSGVPVYSVNNFIFLGDDTSSAKAVVKIAQVAGQSLPEPPAWALLLAGFAAFGRSRGRRV
jgi:hypothetical protein